MLPGPTQSTAVIVSVVPELTGVQIPADAGAATTRLARAAPTAASLRWTCMCFLPPGLRIVLSQRSSGRELTGRGRGIRARVSAGALGLGAAAQEVAQPVGAEGHVDAHGASAGGQRP